MASRHRRSRAAAGPGSALAAAVLAAALALASAGAAAPLKAKKPLVKEAVDAFRLESGCEVCYPNDRKACDKDQWNRCCGQEIACHEFHCTEEVLGTLQANTKVRARDEFTTDDEEQVTIPKGTVGKVVRIDGEGDALIKFTMDEYGDDIIKQWVFKTTFWSNLELPDKLVRHRAMRVVQCMDQCTVQLSCRMNEMDKSPKLQKKYLACMSTCKLNECHANEECKGYFEAYGLCKNQQFSMKMCEPAAGAGGAGGADSGDDDASSEEL